MSFRHSFAAALLALVPLAHAADTDGDGIPDNVEAAEGRDPNGKDNDVFALPRLFAMQQYRDFLGREGDAGGIQFYVDQLGGNPALRANIIESFFNSAEFQGVGAPIVRLYLAFFQRTPDYAGFVFQADAVRGGAPLSAVANNFALSPEFQSTYGNNTNTEYVQLLYQNVLGRGASQGEIDFHVNRLASGVTRGEVMVGFSESPEFRTNTNNEVYVTMMYVGMLRRAPEPSGLTFWVDYMDAGNPGLALIAGFLQAPEYRQRFLPSAYVLNVARTGTGTGAITSSPAGISCGGDCSETYAAGTVVTLTAAPTASPASAASTFLGWTGACTGTGACVVTLDASRSVSAQFVPSPNIAFVTATTHTPNVGGLAGADGICQSQAGAAGLAGTFRAFLSTTTVNAITRLGSASGWARPDGKPVANSPADIAAGKFHYPIRLSADGTDRADATTHTATANGTLTGTTCGDYTSTAGTIAGGIASAQGSLFTTVTTRPCTVPASFYCLGVDRAASVQVTPPAQRRIVFVTASSWTPGAGLADADSRCQGEASANSLPGTYKALLATNTASAISRFSSTGAPWARMDGALISTSPTALFSAATTNLDTSPGLTADGLNFLGNDSVWGGASHPASVGNAASTCGNWTNPAETKGTSGRAGFSDVQGYFASSQSSVCDVPRRLTCLQQ